MAEAAKAETAAAKDKNLKKHIANIGLLWYYPVPRAGVAQLAEQLICNQQVAGSSPITSSICI